VIFYYLRYSQVKLRTFVPCEQLH